MFEIDYKNLTEKELLEKQINRINKILSILAIITLVIFLLFILSCTIIILKDYTTILSFLTGGVFTFVVTRYSDFEMKLIELQREYTKLNNISNKEGDQ